MKLIFVGGTMGSGKTTSCNILKNILENSVFLDGDWCWDMSPFTVNDRTKALVIKNIQDLLRNFIESKCFENIIFCWVMHENSIVDDILSGIDISNLEFYNFSLILSEEALRKRLGFDIENGIRTEDVVNRSVERISLYNKMDTIKLDVSNITAEEAAKKIAELCN